MNFYYTAPSNEAFEDMKRAAQTIWSGYDDPYKTEKLDRIKDMGNVGDNFMYLFAMFDPQNQQKIMQLLTKETLESVMERLRAGGSHDHTL